MPLLDPLLLTQNDGLNQAPSNEPGIILIIKFVQGFLGGEDIKCSNSVQMQVNAQWWSDHRNYFGTTSVPNYCPKFDERLYPPNGRVQMIKLEKLS